MTDRKVTVIDIAHAAGVSKSTVSLVLQGSPLVKDETRARVNARHARSRLCLQSRRRQSAPGDKSKIVGIVVNDLTNSFFAELAVGVDMIVQSAGYVQFLANTAEDVDRQREVIASMREHGIAGLILSPARGTDAAGPQAAGRRAAFRSSSPCATFPAQRSRRCCPTIMRGAREAAVQHLLDLGHRRIAFLGGFPDTQVFTERAQGYRDALADAGLAVDDELRHPVRAVARRRRRRHRARAADHAASRADGGGLLQRCGRLRRLRRPARPSPGARAPISPSSASTT